MNIEKLRTFLDGLLEDRSMADSADRADLVQWAESNAATAEELLEQINTPPPRFIQVSTAAIAGPIRHVVALDDRGRLWAAYSTPEIGWSQWETLPRHPGGAVMAEVRVTSGPCIDGRGQRRDHSAEGWLCYGKLHVSPMCQAHAEEAIAEYKAILNEEDWTFQAEP